MTNAVELVDVRRTFDGTPPVHAVDGVSLSITSGTMTAIVGPSGSGKSTLLNLMGTLDRASSGSVAINQIDTRSLNDGELADLRAWNIGFVFQQFHLLERLTARENVALGLFYRDLPQRERLAAADNALRSVGLGDKSHVTTPKLSGGQRQRVAIARAIVGDPAVLFADEPTGNLDSATSTEIVTLLHDLNQTRGTTIVIITHDHAVADAVPRRVAIIDGHIDSDDHTTP